MKLTYRPRRSKCGPSHPKLVTVDATMVKIGAMKITRGLTDGEVVIHAGDVTHYVYVGGDDDR